MENLIDEIIYTKAKRVSLSVNQNGVVVLKIPQKDNISMSAIRKFIYSKENWIKRTKNRILSRNKDFEEFISYKKISILGKILNITFSPQYKNATITEHEVIVKDLKKLISYLKKIALEVLQERTLYLSKVMKLDNYAFKIDNSKTKWGSCSSVRLIKINFRVIMLPHKFVDYIIIHELAHLKQMNHSQSFWREVEKYIPDFKKVKKELINYEFLLEMYR